MTRYFYHPESDSLFTTTDGSRPIGDGLAEELDEQQYREIKGKQHMATNALAVLDQRPTSLSTETAKFFDENTNIPDKVTTPSLSYSGKTWAISLNGESTKLMKKNADGDEEPLAVMRVVVLGWNQRRGRAYYEGAYDKDKPGMPVCWSDDGITPDSRIKEPKAAKCDGCPLSIKGSKVTEQGKGVVACAEHRMLAVVPSKKLEIGPLRLKLAVTSDYDGQSPEHEAEGWYAWKGYTDMLRARQVPHTAMLVTKMKFDKNKEWPKVLFSVDEWLPEATLQSLMPVIKGDEVKGLLSGTWTPAGTDGKLIEGTKAEVTADDGAAAQTAADAKANAEKVAADEKAARKAVKKAAADAAAAAAKAAAEDDDDGEMVMLAPGSPEPVKPQVVAPKVTASQPTAAATPAAPAATVPAALGSLLDEWKDD